MAVEPKTPPKTMCVACSLPHGLEIQLYKPVPTVPAGAPAPAPEMVGEPIVLAGANAENAVGGYGFTEGVDPELFRAWMDQNKAFTAVRRNLIFAEDTPDRARDRAREQAGLVTGFEGINPEATGQGVTADKYEGRPAAAATKAG